eukprot:1231898-Pleurochrysis_carterae.AAC.2
MSCPIRLNLRQTNLARAVCACTVARNWCHDWHQLLDTQLILGVSEEFCCDLQCTTTVSMPNGCSWRELIENTLVLCHRRGAALTLDSAADSRAGRRSLSASDTLTIKAKHRVSYTAEKKKALTETVPMSSCDQTFVLEGKC